MGDISRMGIFEGDLVTTLLAIKTGLNAVLTKLDSDTGVNGTDYSSLWALSKPGTEVEAAGTGLGQGDIYEFLDQFYTNQNGVVAKLNADSGVSDTDYAALTDKVGEDKLIFSGMNQTDLITVLQEFITGIATLTAKLDADATVGDTDYAATCNVTDTVDDSGQ